MHAEYMSQDLNVENYIEDQGVEGTVMIKMDREGVARVCTGLTCRAA
jgi:hypothetical protein